MNGAFRTRPFQVVKGGIGTCRFRRQPDCDTHDGAGFVSPVILRRFSVTQAEPAELTTLLAETLAERGNGMMVDAVGDGKGHGRRPSVASTAIKILPGFLFFVLASSILYQSPCVGIADILDYWRVMRPAGIDHIEMPASPGYYVQCMYRTFSPDLTGMPSSSAFLALLARALPVFGADPGFMDLRQVGLLYIVLLTAVLVAAPLCGLPVWEVLLLAYIALDPSYLLFFNSFYADPTLFVALIGGYCWFRLVDSRLAAERERCFASMSAARIGGAVVVLTALCVLGGASKMQYVVFPVAAFLALLAVQIVRPSFRSRGSFALMIAVVFLSTAVAWLFFLGPGPRFLKFNNYNAVFGGIAIAASDADRALADLGISPEYRDLPRTDIWSAGMVHDHPVHQELAGLSRASLAREYLSDPKALTSTYLRICSELSKVVGHPRGNRTRPASDRGPRRRIVEYPLQHSKTIRRIYAGSTTSLSVLLLLGLLAPIATRFECLSTTVFLVSWVALQFVVSVLGEGFVNLHQHLIGARLGLDLLALQIIVVVVGRSSSWASTLSRKPRREDPLTPRQLHGTADALGTNDTHSSQLSRF